MLKNVMRKMSRSIFSHFGAIHSYNVSQSKIADKFTKNSYFEGSKSFKVIDVDSNKKLVTSACYDKQHVCAYLQPFSRYTR